MVAKGGSQTQDPQRRVVLHPRRRRRAEKTEDVDSTEKKNKYGLKGTTKGKKTLNWRKWERKDAKVCGKTRKKRSILTLKKVERQGAGIPHIVKEGLNNQKKEGVSGSNDII